MAGGVTTTGLREYDLAVRALPAVLSAELQGAAQAAAGQHYREIQTTMQARGWALARDVHIEHHSGEQRYTVFVAPHPRPENLPLWLEHGTRYMVAQPFHGPSVARLRVTYPQAVDAALQRAYDRTVNR
jgi:hypothetical protein